MQAQTSCLHLLVRAGFVIPHKSVRLFWRRERTIAILFAQFILKESRHQ
jgi:hypothetical protein